MYFSLCRWMRYYAAAGRRGIGQSWRVSMDCSSWDDFMLNVDGAAVKTVPFAGGGIQRRRTGRAVCSNFGKKPVRSTVLGGCDEAKMRMQFSLVAVVGSPLPLSYGSSS